jgi:hypothetical protein
MDPKSPVYSQMLTDLVTAIHQQQARLALSERFNPQHDGRSGRVELEKLAGARTLLRKVIGELDIPDASEGPPISVDERARRDLYRDQMRRNLEQSEERDGKT